MSYSNPLVQCPRCDLGGTIGCPCCGGEGVTPLYDAEDWIEQERDRIDDMMAADEQIVRLMDWMIATHPDGEVNHDV